MIGGLKRNSVSILHHQQFCTKSKKNNSSDCYWSQVKTDTIFYSQKRAICAASVEQRDSRYASNTLPARKRVVICGGGVMGAAVAYHLGLRGWADETVVLEKGRYVKDYI